MEKSVKLLSTISLDIIKLTNLLCTLIHDTEVHFIVYSEVCILHDSTTCIHVITCMTSTKVLILLYMYDFHESFNSAHLHVRFIDVRLYGLCGISRLKR